MGKQFILALTEHRKFGLIFSSYIITKGAEHSFYTSIEKANQVNVKELAGVEKDVVTIQGLISQYDDICIANFFTKKKEDAVEFIKNVGDDLIVSRIRPFIEIRLNKIIKLLSNTPVEIYLKDKNYSKIYAADRIYLAGPNAKAVFNFNKTEDGLQYFLNINHESESISLKNKKIQVITHDPCSIVLSDKLYSFQHIDSKKLQPFFDKDFVQIPKQSEKVYFEKFVFNAIKQFTVKSSGFDIIEQSLEPKIYLYFQNDLQGVPVLLMKLGYGDRIIIPNINERMFLTLNYSDSKVEFVKTPRNFTKENEVSNALFNWGLSSKDHVHYYPTLDTDNTDVFYDTIHWINKNNQNLASLNIILKQDFFDKKYLLKRIDSTITIIETNDWFDVRGTVVLGDYEIAFVKLRKHIVRNNREYELPDGSIAILPLEWFAKYKELFAFAELDGDKLLLNKMHFGLIGKNFSGTDTKKYNRLEELFSNNYQESSDVPDGIEATLRPYQITGFNWMNHLRTNGFGGCLADDMGLGKTLQTLSLMLDVSRTEVEKPLLKKSKAQEQLSLFDAPTAHKSPKVSPTSLIVMPSSLIHNWYNEAKKFTPQLRVLQHVGNQRDKDLSRFYKYDIVLTTYGLIRNDAEWLSSFPFEYIILDESQAIKNPDSKNYKSILKLKSKNKLALTGTPIENSLTDLWSQMNFANRGLLGNFNFFKKEFVLPIEKDKSETKAEKLQALIHPFVLRRTKDEVAKDLPPKTEQIRLCEMAEDQKRMYEEEKSAVRNNILEKMELVDKSKSSMQVLAAITRLRQLANHPKLINSESESGKFVEVVRMLENVISEGHKVLIFSSFVKHLEVYSAYLKKKKRKFSILTGQTKDRQQVIDDFQNNDDNQVFLISLKAGGVGLNLTAADYVFLLDPWWNPAAENQAINRAHRIGQDKKVFVYRFIAANSIEEKIIQLQDRKTDLANQFVNSNNPFAAFAMENIHELFN